MSSGGDPVFVLDAGASEAPQIPVHRPERRQLTVLFCDLVGFTELADRTDPEELAAILRMYRGIAAETVERFKGYVAQHLGDGILAYFGHPVADEHDAEHAVRAGLAIIGELASIAMSARRPAPLQARVAVHSGPVLVGGGSGSTAVGQTVNLAARIEGVADPGTVFVSEATLPLLKGRFAIQDAGTPALKGVSRGLRLYRVTAVTDGAPPDRPRVALVGRELERSALLDAHESAAGGTGCLVLISGEPGIGKTRLIRDLAGTARGPHTWLQFHCQPLSRSTPLAPFAEGIRETCVRMTTGHAPTDDGSFASALQALGFPAADLDIVQELIGSEGPPPSTASPEGLRQRTFDALTEWIVGLSERQPLVLVCEDVHWADPTTIVLLDRLVRRATGHAMLLLVTHRRDFAPTWSGAGVVTLPLQPLSPEDTQKLVCALPGGAGLSAETASRIVQRSDGNPLFLEELVGMVVESRGSGGDEAANAIPHTLQASLLARLDRLGDVRTIAQVASVLGREFSLPLLAAVAALEDSYVRAGVRRLVTAGLFAADEEQHLAFRHALLREAAYDTLVLWKRRVLHGRVADALLTLFPERTEAEPQIMAHHLLHAGRYLSAGEWSLLAGRQAAARAALAEAVARYRTGLAAVERAEPAVERDRLELQLSIHLGNALMGLRTFATLEAVPAWERAATLARSLGDAEELSSALNGLAAHAFDQGNCDEVLRLGTLILETAADSSSARVAGLRAHGTLALAHLYRGDPRSAVRHADRAIELYQPGDFEQVTYGVTYDQGAVAYGAAAAALWIAGSPDRALERAVEGVGLAHGIGHILTIAMAQTFEVIVRARRGEVDHALALADDTVAMCDRFDVPFWKGLVLLVAGEERAKRDGGGQGLTDIAAAFEILSRMGSRTGSALGFAASAEAHLAASDLDSALGAVNVGLEIATALGQPFYDAELLRLRAEVHRRRDDPGAAEAAYLKSLDVAVAQGARIFELRAATGLARLLSDLGREDDGKRRLADVYARFTEGFETRDLKGAAALLD